MIVGQMSLFRFPMWRECLADLASHVDALYLRVDMRGDINISEAMNVANEASTRGHTICVRQSNLKWNVWNWREEMLRMLDDVKPDIVLTCDEDEKFGPEVEKDIVYLMASEVQQVAFGYEYPMPSVDGWKPEGRNKPFPSTPHVKAFKWRPGLTFKGYRGRGFLPKYHKKNYVIGESKMLHYCWYNEEIRKQRLWTNREKERWAAQ